MRRNVVSIPYFFALKLLINAVELVANLERNKKNLAVQPCRISGGTSTVKRCQFHLLG